MSVNDQLSFIAGLTYNPTEPELRDDEQSSTSNSKPSTSHEEEQPEDNLVFFTENADEEHVDIEALQTEKKVAKVMQKLQFSAPGEQMIGSIMGMRKARQKRVREVRERQHPREEPERKVFHDVEGRLIVNGQPFLVCDCLAPLCHGCHSPCPDCNGRMCGPSCQKGRRLVIVKMETNGEIRINPYTGK